MPECACESTTDRHRASDAHAHQQDRSELFIVDNSDSDWKDMRYLHDWCQISKSIDIATGYFEIGAKGRDRQARA
jgi:hypothetical protein